MVSKGLKSTLLRKMSLLTSRGFKIVLCWILMKVKRKWKWLNSLKLNWKPFSLKLSMLFTGGFKVKENELHDQILLKILFF